MKAALLLREENDGACCARVMAVVARGVACGERRGRGRFSRYAETVARASARRGASPGVAAVGENRGSFWRGRSGSAGPQTRPTPLAGWREGSNIHWYRGLGFFGGRSVHFGRQTTLCCGEEEYLHPGFRSNKALRSLLISRMIFQGTRHGFFLHAQFTSKLLIHMRSPCDLVVALE